MWTARGAYRTAEGEIVLLPERSALWTDKAALIREMERSHPGLAAVELPGGGEWYRWVDQDGTQRFVVIEEA